MDPSTKELLHNGIAVAILVPIVAFLLWAGRVVVRSLLTHIDDFFKGVLEQQKESAAAMKELARAFTDISARCLACRQDAVATLRDAEGSITKKLIEVTAAVHDKTFGELHEGFATLGTRFEVALTGTAESIRKSNAQLLAEVERKRLEEQNAELKEELSRPHDVGDGRVHR